MRYYILERFNWHKPLCRETLLSKNACDRSMGVKWVQEIILLGRWRGGGVAIVFALALVAFTHNSKKPSSQEKVS